MIKGLLFTTEILILNVTTDKTPKVDSLIKNKSTSCSFLGRGGGEGGWRFSRVLAYFGRLCTTPEAKGRITSSLRWAFITDVVYLNLLA